MCAARFDDGDLHGVLPIDNILHVACSLGKLGTVKHIISQNIVSIDSKGEFGRTPVMRAAKKGHVTIFKLLVREGAGVSIVDDYSNTILHHACAGEHLGMVKHIISQNIVSIDSKGQCGRTPVMYAAEQGHVALFKLLMKEGADLSIVDDDGINILHIACVGGNVDIVKHIISQNIVSIDSKGQCGRTPVMYAVERGHVALFKLLMKEGADLSIVDDDGINILHIACVGGNVDIVKHIISQNIVSIDSKGEYGRTPGMYAAQEDQMAVFKTLESEGADLSRMDDNGTNILHLASLHANLDMVKYIISRNMVSIDSKGMYGRTPVMFAAETEHVDVIKLFVTEGADLSIADDNGNNILHAACAGGHLDMVQHIISQNIVSIDSKGQSGITPLMWAVKKGHVEVIELLVTEGADVSVVDAHGDTIITLARQSGNMDIVQHIF